MTVWGVVSDCEALAAVFMLFELINHRDREILHRNVTVAPGVSQQSIAAKSNMASAPSGAQRASARAYARFNQAAKVCGQPDYQTPDRPVDI